MRITFRTRLLSIVGIAAVAFLLIIVASSVVAGRVERQLAFIQRRYVPKVELEPQLQGQLERLERGFQDAVAAHDTDALEATRDLKSDLLARLADAKDATEPSDAAELSGAVEAYWARAYDVSRRLLAGETGEAVLDAIATMQANQARAAALVKKTAALDRGEMAAAFEAAFKAETTARSYQIWASVACLGSVLLLSLGLSRGLVRSVSALTRGFARFGRGEFGEPIPTAGRDELADLARDANAMAASLDRHISDRMRIESALKASNQELEAFSYSVAHDLRAPLRGINGYSRALVEDYGTLLDAEAHDYLDRIVAATERMGELIDALLSLSRVTRVDFRREAVNLSRLADAVVTQLRASQPERAIDFVNEEKVVAQGDAPLLRALLENLIGNAWKFTGARPGARISFGVEDRDGTPVYYVRDNGAGFDMAYAQKLFAPFQRLHTEREFAGTGIGLATVQRIVNRHGGRVWADGRVGQGATFHFTLTNTVQGAVP
ncbi:MAG: sensor histidine kinase [Polyangiaceae bacterium]|jgi:signal transduction histidine kinase